MHELVGAFLTQMPCLGSHKGGSTFGHVEAAEFCEVGVRRKTISPSLLDWLALSEEDTQVSGMELLHTTLSPGWSTWAMAEPVGGRWGGMQRSVEEDRLEKESHGKSIFLGAPSGQLLLPLGVGSLGDWGC